MGKWNDGDGGWSPRQIFILIALMIAVVAVYPVAARAAQVVEAIIRDGANPGLRATVDGAGALKVTGDVNVGNFPRGYVIELIAEPVSIDGEATFQTGFHDTAPCDTLVVFWSEQPGPLLSLQPGLIMSPDGAYEADVVRGVQSGAAAFFPAFDPGSFSRLGIPDDFSAMPAVTPFAAVAFENGRTTPTTLDAAWLYCSSE